MTSGSARKATLILLTLLVLAGLLIFGPALVRLVRGDERRDAWAPQWRKDFILSAEARPDPAPQEEDCLGRWKIIAHFRYPDNMAKEVSEPEH